jgi:glycosyltransferase involved in cell wall biosynthesis
MRHIAITVCTYNRPAGLQSLLAALDRQRLERLTDNEVEIIVIDNSQSGSAEDICAAYMRNGRFKATFVHEPRKGLAIARNAALAAARAAHASHVAFIDDDEVPDPAWLEALVCALERTSAAAAIGPVSPIMESEPSPWLVLSAYGDRRQPQGGCVEDGYTCNAILAMAAIDGANLQFDARFNETGGEDTYFFKQLREQGMKIAWAEQALVHAIVPKHRMSVGWILRRWYRTGMIEAHLGRFDPASLKGKLVNLARGMARIVVGAGRIAGAALLSPWRKPDALVASFYTACRGAGLVANVFERNYEEYARSRYR